MFFIQQRDELCKKGEVLLTPALSYTDQHLTRLAEANRKERMTKEQRDEEDRKKICADASNGSKVVEPDFVIVNVWNDAL